MKSFRIAKNENELDSVMNKGGDNGPKLKSNF